MLKNKKKSIRKRIRIDERIIDQDDDLKDSDIENISGLLNKLEEYLLMIMILNIKGLMILDTCLMKMKMKIIMSQN